MRIPSVHVRHGEKYRDERLFKRSGYWNPTLRNASRLVGGSKPHFVFTFRLAIMYWASLS
jgi:hypothetical protein